MSNYIYTNGQLYNVDELMHYGVPGMKWGHRKAMRMEKRATRRFGRVGKARGKADFYNEKAAAIQKKHNSSAAALDKQAKTYDRQGKHIKAELARKAAGALRERGLNASASSIKEAARYKKKADKLLAKANKYSEKKHVDLGKNKINSIIKKSKEKGYNSAKSVDEYNRGEEIRSKYGDRGYDAYSKMKGYS